MPLTYLGGDGLLEDHLVSPDQPGGFLPMPSPASARAGVVRVGGRAAVTAPLHRPVLVRGATRTSRRCLAGVFARGPTCRCCAGPRPEGMPRMVNWGGLVPRVRVDRPPDLPPSSCRTGWFSLGGSRSRPIPFSARGSQAGSCWRIFGRHRRRGADSGLPAARAPGGDGPRPPGAASVRRERVAWPCSTPRVPGRDDRGRRTSLPRSSP